VKKVSCILFALVVALSMGAMTAPAMAIEGSGFEPASESSTRNVPEDYDTIQEAIDAAEEFDTVRVAAGSYEENVVINKSLTLEGAQAGVDARTRSGAETTINPGEGIGIKIISDSGRSVIIDGLTVQNVEHGIGAPEPVMADSITVKNVRVLNATVFGISSAFTLEMVVEQCYVEGAQQGIDAGAVAPFPATVATFRDNEIVNAEFGITGHLEDSVIEGNLISDFNQGGTGISGQFVNTEIRNNTVTGYTEGAGLSFAPHYGRHLSANLNVKNNAFTGNNIGIYVFDRQTELDGITVNNNIIAGNSLYGVWNEGGETLDATRNWWGHVSGPGRVGPGAGNRVSTKVLYSPWLGDEPGSEPMTWGVDPTGFIQEAIDEAAAGDTVIAAEGKYEEELTISKSLTLRSAHGGEVTAIVGSVSIDLDSGTVFLGGHEAGFSVDANGGAFAILMSIDNGSELTITDNSLTGAAAGISTRDGLLRNGTVRIDYNDIHENDCGIYLESVEGGSTVLINYNGLAQNHDLGVHVESSAIIVDATNNWWGHAGGPSGDVVDPVTGAPAGGVGAAVSENVNFDPWLDGPLYRIKISSTAGGSVTAPGEGTFFYTGGTVVDLETDAERGHRFDRWTGAGGTIANANAPTTTITIDGNYSITARFQREDCFIATAAYGSDTAGDIGVLKQFRDTVLLSNALGAELVSLYYRTSPPIAGCISRNEILRTAVRVGMVDPIVAVLNWSRGSWSEGGQSVVTMALWAIGAVAPTALVTSLCRKINQWLYLGRSLQAPYLTREKSHQRG